MKMEELLPLTVYPCTLSSKKVKTECAALYCCLTSRSQCTSRLEDFKVKPHSNSLISTWNFLGLTMKLIIGQDSPIKTL